MNVNTLTLRLNEIPADLALIPDAPKQLFWLGTPPEELLNRPKIAIVGSRKASPYGRLVTEDLASKLSHEDILIISGLAFGVDSIAHRAVLAAGGPALAILPTSLDNIYPASHRQLAEDILKAGGALASEYPPGSETYRVNFIARNRIVSGLSDGLLITEAVAASGTMHTARFALEQGKTVMALPGNINSPLSEGCNNLIKAGATPVTTVEDVFFALNIRPQAAAKKIFRGSQSEHRIYRLISDGVTTQEELAHRSSMDSSQLAQSLTMLELNGYIKALGGGNWAAA